MATNTTAESTVAVPTTQIYLTEVLPAPTSWSPPQEDNAGSDQKPTASTVVLRQLA